jgi:hypothetical protein
VVPWGCLPVQSKVVKDEGFTAMSVKIHCQCQLGKILQGEEYLQVLVAPSGGKDSGERYLLPEAHSPEQNLQGLDRSLEC